ncbi:hypothetical protein [Rhodanobacter sp. MP7CTX1]|jgi:dTDP-4-amino-4,6-dideoxygalactose transaminase|uniref:hypothetical protein n=1 Tax=Rhodanobacter sp. MP7CTX1 TaxID=2723084 RepID=UPI00161A8EF3|nr:hypothetical protein [Rhodanobacter sp. MP7CTX1]MBB6187261.1 dTDP-4-amino-4,6-dideoxygalactose transaminase [Rhodanobacter sp. MP7CTX1]
MDQPDFLDFATPDIQEAEIAEVEACMRSASLGTSPRVVRFEQDFASHQVSFPTSTKLSDSELERVINLMKVTLEKN